MNPHACTEDQIVEQHRLRGHALELVDLHILASCAIAHATPWTVDRRVQQAADVITKQ